jgi:hypothetical protein
MSDIWQDYQMKVWLKLQASIQASRKARGYNPPPNPAWLSKAIREQPNLYLKAFKAS